VHLDADAHTKTHNNQKKSPKNAKHNLVKTKIIVNTEILAKWGPSCNI